MNSTQDPSIAPDSAGMLATGKLTTRFAGYSYSEGRSIALQPDGKILVAGGSRTLDNYAPQGGDFAMARYNADGSLDQDFSANGKLNSGSSSYHDIFHSVAVQPNGKILAVGTGSWWDGDYSFALARYYANGSLDKSFASRGLLISGFDHISDDGDLRVTSDSALSAALQPDGKIVIAGVSEGHFALARYHANGSPDQGFAGGGLLTTDFGGSGGYGSALALQADGKILVAGTSNGDFALARYNADGSLDPSFSGDGWLASSLGGSDAGASLVLQADGKILVAGTSDGDFALARYNADGSLDPSFSGDGWLVSSLGGSDAGASLALQPDSKILVAGTSDGDFALARYNADGSLDPGFSGDGWLTTDFGGVYDAGYGVALQADGKILVAGQGNGNFALARYNPDGSPDTTFGDYVPIGHATAQLAVGKEDLPYILKSANLLQGFTDPDGDTLTVTSLAADHGTLQSYGNGIWTLTPAANYSGTVHLAYTVSDARGGSIAAQQSLTLKPAQDAPAIFGRTSFVASEGSHSGMMIGQAYATDPDGDALAYRLGPGNADLNGNGQPAFALDARTGVLSVNDPGDLDFKAHPIFSLEVTVTDPGGLSSSGTLQVLRSDLNEIHGTPGPDTLRGTAGWDLLDGGAGDDRLIGGWGSDTLLGGDGNDWADFSGSTTSIYINLATGWANGLNRQGTYTVISIENLSGGFAGDSLSGDANSNILWGGPGDDGMEGSAGDDRLGGGLGNDTIKGGNGNDTLYGSKGLDTLAGGAGADRFLYTAAIDTGNTAAARDVIADFSRAEGDKLDVRAWDAQPSVAGTQHWSFVASFTGQTGQIRFDSSAQLVLFDQNGDQQADFLIELSGVAALSADDFVLA